MTARFRAGETVSLKTLRAFAARLLTGAGLAEADAARMAEILVFAQASGIDSHGLMHLPSYLAGIARGAVNPRPERRLVSSLGAVAVMDGDHGPGPLNAAAACDLAIARAEAHGVGVIAVRASGHFGAGAAFIQRMTARGFVGLVLSNASPTVAPWGAKSAVFGTNPIAFGAPRGDGEAVIVDMATTVGTRARIRKALAAGEAIPLEWAIDADGRPTQDPAAALKGTMRALGGDKGTTLSLMVELLCAGLSGGPAGVHVRPPQDEQSPHAEVSHFVLALAPEAFGGRDAIAAKVAEVAGHVEAAEPVDPARPVRLPGARAAELRARREREGLTLSRPLADALARAAIVAAGFEA